MAEAVKSAFTTVAPVNRARQFERVALLLVWALLIAGFGLAMPRSFLSWGNFSIMFASYAPAALLALAIIVPLTAGDYDLAVGATLTLSASMIGVLNVWQHIPIGLVLVIVLGAGAVVGLVHALFIIYFRVPSLVVTLGTTSLMSGLVQWITNSSTIGGIDNALIMAVVGSRLFGIPYAFYYALVAAVVMWYVFDYTPFGRRLLFVGRGREVARLNGIAVDRVRLGALLISSGPRCGGRHSLCRRARLRRSLFGPQLSAAGFCRRIPRRHHHPARPLQPMGGDGRRLFPGDRHHRPFDARDTALGDQRLQRRRADHCRHHFAADARSGNLRHRLTLIRLPAGGA